MEKMKGNSNSKQATVFLMAFVLVVGLAGAGGLVYGDSDTSTSEISVNVADVDIEITALEQGETELTTDPVDTSDVNGDPEDIYIEVTVTLEDGTQDDIDEIKADFYYDGTGDQGDAVIGDGSHPTEDAYLLSGSPNTEELGEWTLTEDFDEGTTDQAVYEATLGIHNMMRYGDWDVEAYVLDTGGNDNTDYEPFSVSTFVQIEVDGTTIQGTAAPGQRLTTEATEDNHVEWTSEDTIVTYRINSEYLLSADEPEELTSDDDETDDVLTGFTIEEYLVGEENVDTGIPMDSELGADSRLDGDPIEPFSFIDVDTGVDPETYSGEVIHTLENTETD